MMLGSLKQLAIAGFWPWSSSAHRLRPRMEEGFISLFNGVDLAGWKVPEGDNGHWKVVDGVIDYDARSEAKGAKDLVSEKEYGDFVLELEWRITDTPWINQEHPLHLCPTAPTPRGSTARN